MDQNTESLEGIVNLLKCEELGRAFWSFSKTKTHTDGVREHI